MKTRSLWVSKITVGFLLVSCAESVLSQPRIKTVDDALIEGVNNNPEVRASYHNFEAAREEQRVAKGRYFPRIDFDAQAGKIDSDDPKFLGDKYESRTSRLAITQPLFTGGATRNLVKKFEHLKYARYYELRDTTEALALEVITAYLDVLRYRKLVKLAEDNYIEHRLIYNDIKQRAQAGISRAVDFEQAEARLALAESNLLTENTNLHDVSRRYFRLLGELPAADLAEINLPLDTVPTSRTSALTEAYEFSPVLLSAAYNYSASKAEMKEKNAPYMPSVDLRARQDKFDDDVNGLTGQFDETAIELVFTYNLFRGGSDSAAKRQYRELVSYRDELREKACRDVTQTVSISFNDILSLTKQKELLARNQVSSEKVREAYRNQFDIGQRTLLDLLDTENEYFDVRRSYTNATYDLQIAQAGTLAGMGRLIAAFNTQGLQNVALEKVDLPEDAEVSGYCNLNINDDVGLERQEILERVLQSERLKPRTIVKTAPSVAAAPISGTSKKLLSFRMNVQYQNGSAALLPSYNKDIETAAEYLKDNPEVSGVIEGHTDSVGSEDYNLRLSQSRAETLKSVLVREYGISSSRLTAKGYGELVPIATNANEEGRRQNRRVLLVIVDE
ncbi:MAG: TolC family outer membrane protein [Cellvibrionaceae bacterium]